MPLWFVSLLSDALPLLQAEETLTAVTAARAAMVDKNDYRSLVRQLRRMAEPYDDTPVEMAETEEQKKAAAAWLAASGVKVVKH